MHKQHTQGQNSILTYRNQGSKHSSTCTRTNSTYFGLSFTFWDNMVSLNITATVQQCLFFPLCASAYILHFHLQISDHRRWQKEGWNAGGKDEGSFFRGFPHSLGYLYLLCPFTQMPACSDGGEELTVFSTSSTELTKRSGDLYNISISFCG